MSGRKWKVYRRVLVTGELSRGAHLELTKRGLSRAPGEPGYYNWNWTLEAESGAEAELLMEHRLENLLDPYGVTYACTKTVLTPEELTSDEIEQIAQWPKPPRSETWRNPPGSR